MLTASGWAIRRSVAAFRRQTGHQGALPSQVQSGGWKRLTMALDVICVIDGRGSLSVAIWFVLYLVPLAQSRFPTIGSAGYGN